MVPLLFLSHGELELGHTVCQDPSFAGTGATRQGFLLGDHAGASNFVGIVVFHVWGVQFVGKWKMESVVVDVVSVGVAINSVLELFYGVGERGTRVSAASVVPGMSVVHSSTNTIVLGVLLGGVCDVWASAEVVGAAIATSFLGLISASDGQRPLVASAEATTTLNRTTYTSVLRRRKSIQEMT